MGGVTPFTGWLKTISTIAFQQVTPPSSTHPRTPDSVIAHAGRRPDIIDNSYTTVDFTDGVRAMLDLCMFADGAANEEEIVAVGDRARLEVLIPEGAILFSPRTGRKNPKRVERAVVPVDKVALNAGAHFGSTLEQHRHFLAAVRGESPVRVTADDGLRAVAIGAAAEISAREKRVVEMAELGF
jgi:predicted dehydrogenase